MTEEVGARGYIHAHLAVLYDYKNTELLFNCTVAAQVRLRKAHLETHQ